MRNLMCLASWYVSTFYLLHAPIGGWRMVEKLYLFLNGKDNDSYWNAVNDKKGWFYQR
jgi:hypothetical protein